jgi:tetratricopeptide (TPR) repeat protein
MRSIPVIALSDGGAAARRAHEDRKVRFAKYGWWAPPREIDLRHVAQALRQQKRLPDALETCRLNAEMHPYTWNVWLNLGSTQRAAGRTVEALQSLRRVLELDPNNFNADVIRPILADGLKPNVIRYGATVAEMQTALAGLCKTMKTRRIEPTDLPYVKVKQVQIDCDGFAFLGKPRRAEFVFRDDSLELVWIITSAEERASILRAMADANGAPTQRNNRYVAFANNRTALRLDRPGVLFYSERLAPHTRSWFEKPADGAPAPK